MKSLIAVLLLSPLVAGAAMPGSGSGLNQQEWNFRVLLDGKEIGYHNYSLVDEDGVQRLSAEAEFAVRFLFITAYRYEHVNHETWQGDCLKQIESETDANGRQFSVRGAMTDEGLAIERIDGVSEVPGCVKTFAYWNPEILREARLLNSQTGEVLDIEVEAMPPETLNVRGQDTKAMKYRLLARNIELEIWYSENDEWLALESTVKGGRKLRYELV